jgi:hypothetical protein
MLDRRLGPSSRGGKLYPKGPDCLVFSMSMRNKVHIHILVKFNCQIFICFQSVYSVLSVTKQTNSDATVRRPKKCIQKRVTFRPLLRTKNCRFHKGGSTRI